MDVDARLQLFDLKTKYQFQTTPGVDQYNMPLYDLQTSVGGNPQASISFYPVYQGFMGPAYINGVQIQFQTQREIFFSAFPNIVQTPIQIGVGDGTQGPYTLQIPFIGPPSTPLNPPINALLRGHVDMTGIIYTNTNQDPPLRVNTLNLSIPSTSIFPAVYITALNTDGSNIIVQDSGQFISGSQNYGLLMEPGSAPFGYKPLNDGVGTNVYSTSLNTINYLTGAVTVRFNEAIPAGAIINAQCYFYNSGLPRMVLFYNNILTLRVVPDRPYLVELDAYLTPAAFLATSQSIQFAYMCEYIARGAARKILSDTGDVEQLEFYEPFFREQEMLVWKRSQRQFTSTRTQTIYSQGQNQGQNFYNNMGVSSL